MKNKSFFCAVLMVTSMSTFAKDKIVGGVKVTSLQDAPYIVSLEGSCGGSIISSQWVLTAAHCAGYFSSVKGGILNLKDQGTTIKVKRVIKHPEYSRATFTHDFALVELEEKIDFKKSGMKPVKLATADFAHEGHQDPGVEATVYGFGDIGSWEDNVSKDLNKVMVPIVSHDDANRTEAYDGRVDETMLAAGYDEGGKDSCQGDSGGPMVVFQDNTPVQVGVVSWGEGCAAVNKYGVYSKVSHDYEWIKETAGL